MPRSEAINWAPRRSNLEVGESPMLSAASGEAVAIAEIQRKSRRVANSIIHLCLLPWKIEPDLGNHQIKTNDILYIISQSLTMSYLKPRCVRRSEGPKQ
jgi:hypothetical protein